MGKFIDLTNKRFGCLTVIQQLPERKNNNIIWKCLCDCGNYNNVPGNHLRSGHTTSCGCQQGKRPFEDLTNKKFGKLTVVNLNGKSSNGHLMWKCICECGNSTIVDSTSLRSGHSQSCGCLKSHGEQKIIQLLKNNNIPFETQKTFNECRFKNTNRLAKFDFYVNNKYLIEYDGIQHFEYKGTSWNTKHQLKIIQERDEQKNIWCKNNNIPLIRIPYIHFNDLCLEDLLLETSKYIIN
jgi:hypothetical protein